MWKCALLTKIAPAAQRCLQIEIRKQHRQRHVPPESVAPAPAPAPGYWVPHTCPDACWVHTEGFGWLFRVFDAQMHTRQAAQVEQAGHFLVGLSTPQAWFAGLLACWPAGLLLCWLAGHLAGGRAGRRGGVLSRWGRLMAYVFGNGRFTVSLTHLGPHTAALKLCMSYGYRERSGE